MSLDDIAPTLERIAKGDLEAPTIDRRTDRRAWRKIAVPRDAGIDGDLARAFADFVDEIEQSEIVKSCTCAYGDGVGGGDVEAGFISVVDKRIKAGWALDRAHAAIIDPTTAAVIIRLAAGQRPETIGREILGKRNRPQAIAAAHERIKAGCYALAVHYGYIGRTFGDP